MAQTDTTLPDQAPSDAPSPGESSHSDSNRGEAEPRTAGGQPPIVDAPESGAHRSERSALGKLGHDLLHRRRRFRQFAGVVFVFLVTAMGRPETALFWAGTVLACLGMAVRLWASGFVVKNEVLATTGPYARVRHPLYVGNILICAGFCAASGLWWSVPLALGVLFVFYPETIRYEDQKLRRLFPEQWDAWAARTRALWPSARPYAGGGPSQGTSWSFGLSMMRNGEPVHVAVILACLVFLYARL